jgi:hypothetical protein
MAQQGTASEGNTGAGEKSTAVALILSFFICGLGQVYQGRWKVGAGLFVSAVVSGILISFVIGIPMLLVVWAVNLYDAYAEKLGPL